MTHAPHRIAVESCSLLRVASLATLAAAAMSGCSGEQLYPIRLEVRLADGKPAVGCSIIVMRAEPPEVMSGSEIGPDGSCTPVVSSGGGLPRGTYRVSVSASSGPPVDGIRKAPPFAERYGGHATSGLEFTVGPGQPTTVPFVLQK